MEEDPFLNYLKKVSKYNKEPFRKHRYLKPFSLTLNSCKINNYFAYFIVIIFNLQLASIVLKEICLDYSSVSVLAIESTILKYTSLLFITIFHDFSFTLMVEVCVIFFSCLIISWILCYVFLLIKKNTINTIFSYFRYISICFTWIILIPSCNITVNLWKFDFNIGSEKEIDESSQINISFKIVQLINTILIIMICFLTNLFLEEPQFTLEDSFSRSNRDKSFLIIVIKVITVILFSFCSGQDGWIKYFIIMVGSLILLLISFFACFYFDIQLHLLILYTYSLNCFSGLIMIFYYFQIGDPIIELGSALIGSALVFYLLIKKVLLNHLRNCLIQKKRGAIYSDHEIELQFLRLFQLISKVNTNNLEKFELLGFLSTHIKECPIEDCNLKSVKPAYFPQGRCMSSNMHLNLKDKVYFICLMSSYLSHFIHDKLSSFPVLILITNFHIDFFGNYALAFYILENLEKRKLSFLDTYFQQHSLLKIEFAFLKTHKFNQKQISSINLFKLMSFDSLSNEFDEDIKSVALTKLNFWEKVDYAVPDLNEISKEGISMINKIKLIEKKWDELNKIYSKSLRLHFLYIGFLEHITYNNECMDSLKVKVTGIENTISLSNNEIYFSKDFFYLIIERDNSKVYKIVKSSYNVFPILGYKENELNNSDITILMPPTIKKYHSSFIESYINTSKPSKLKATSTIFLINKKGFLMCFETSKMIIPSIYEGYQYIACCSVSEKIKEAILTDENGKIEGISKNLAQSLNLAQFNFFGLPLYIQQLCYSLADCSLKGDTVVSSFEEIKGTNHLILNLNNNLEEWCSEIKLHEQDDNLINLDSKFKFSKHVSNLIKIFKILGPSERIYELMKNTGWMNRHFSQIKIENQINLVFNIETENIGNISKLKVFKLDFFINTENDNIESKILDEQLLSSFQSRFKNNKNSEPKFNSGSYLNYNQAENSFINMLDLKLNLKSHSVGIFPKNKRNTLEPSVIQNIFKNSSSNNEEQKPVFDNSFLVQKYDNKHYEHLNPNSDKTPEKDLSFPSSSNKNLNNQINFKEKINFISSFDEKDRINNTIKDIYCKNLSEEEKNRNIVKYSRIISNVIIILLIINSFLLLHFLIKKDNSESLFMDILTNIHYRQYYMIDLSTYIFMLTLSMPPSQNDCKINFSIWNSNLYLIGNSSLTGLNDYLRYKFFIEVQYLLEYSSTYGILNKDDNTNVTLSFLDINGISSASEYSIFLAEKMVCSYCFKIAENLNFSLTNSYEFFIKQNCLNPIITNQMKEFDNILDRLSGFESSWNNQILTLFILAMVIVGIVFAFSLPFILKFRYKTNKLLKVFLKLSRKERKEIIDDSNKYYLNLLNDDQNDMRIIEKDEDEISKEDNEDEKEDPNIDKEEEHLGSRTRKFKQYNINIFSHLKNILIIMAVLSSFFIVSYILFVGSINRFNASSFLLSSFSFKFLKANFMLITILEALSQKFSDTITYRNITKSFEYFDLIYENTSQEYLHRFEQSMNQMSSSFQNPLKNILDSDICDFFGTPLKDNCHNFIYSITRQGLSFIILDYHEIIQTIFADSGSQNFNPNVINSQKTVDIFFTNEVIFKNLRDLIFKMISDDLHSYIGKIQIIISILLAFYMILLILVFIAWNKIENRYFRSLGMTKLLICFLPPKIIFSSKRLINFIIKNGKQT